MDTYVICPDCGIKRNVSLAGDCPICAHKITYTRTPESRKVVKKGVCKYCGIEVFKGNTVCGECYSKNLHDKITAYRLSHGLTGNVGLKKASNIDVNVKEVQSTTEQESTPPSAL